MLLVSAIALAITFETGENVLGVEALIKSSLGSELIEAMPELGSLTTGFIFLDRRLVLGLAGNAILLGD